MITHDCSHHCALFGLVTVIEVVRPNQLTPATSMILAMAIRSTKDIRTMTRRGVDRLESLFSMIVLCEALGIIITASRASQTLRNSL